MRTIKLSVTLALVGGLLSSSYGQTILYDKMSSSSSNIIQSAWFAPDGSDYDVYTWDDFKLTSDSTIKEVWWRGGNAITGPGGITGFSVRFYRSLPGGSQPIISALPESETSADYLKGYDIQGLANETQIPGTYLSDYHITLPTALNLTGNTKYWVKITANMTSLPFWGLAQSTSSVGDGKNFRYFTGGPYFQLGSGDLAFQLRGSSVVPEPASMAALATGLMFIARRRTRKSN